jgi:dihydroorotase
MTALIKDAHIINKGRTFLGSVLLEDAFIKEVREGAWTDDAASDNMTVIDAEGKWLMPGVIDDQVHFREPGLTHKGDIRSESRAAVAGGVTSFMDMPNTKPPTTTLEDLEWKFNRAREVSCANYSFFFGGDNDNAGLIPRLDRGRIPGIKLFLGSSTGNMLVDDINTLTRFFSETDLLIATHCEKESVIKKNISRYTSLYGDNLDISFHPKIRSEEACYASSSEAAELAARLGTRLHILHLSTAGELDLLDKGDLMTRKITGEVCVHHLWFTDDDYKSLGNLIKCNPAVKTMNDREALRKAVMDDTVAVVATDHAPHLLSEKEGSCLVAASGAPLVQHSLAAMLEMASMGVITKEKVVEKMSHHPALLYRIDRRGFIRPGYYADLVLVDPQRKTTVSKENILYKCNWSPFENVTFGHTVCSTFVNGKMVYSDGCFAGEQVFSMELRFNN